MSPLWPGLAVYQSSAAHDNHCVRDVRVRPVGQGSVPNSPRPEGLAVTRVAQVHWPPVIEQQPVRRVKLKRSEDVGLALHAVCSPQSLSRVLLKGPSVATLGGIVKVTSDDERQPLAASRRES